MQVYDTTFNIKDHNPNTPFDKWASLEVTNFNSVPKDLETFVLTGALYAVFIHKGSSTNNNTIEYIFTSWLPKSAYELDARPHFEILGEKYKNNDPTSEEEIWIPIKCKE